MRARFACVVLVVLGTVTGCASTRKATAVRSGVSGEWVSVQRLGARSRAAPATIAASDGLLTAEFAGTSRKSAKTSLSSTSPEPEYDTIDQLLETLVDDAD